LKYKDKVELEGSGELEAPSSKVSEVTLSTPDILKCDIADRLDISEYREDLDDRGSQTSGIQDLAPPEVCGPSFSRFLFLQAKSGDVGDISEYRQDEVFKTSGIQDLAPPEVREPTF
jgi:hypothetical protein